MEMLPSIIVAIVVLWSVRYILGRLEEENKREPVPIRVETDRELTQRSIDQMIKQQRRDDLL